MSIRPDQVRNLAAWGYESGDTDTEVEVDVWTINDIEDEQGESDIERARRLLSGVTVIDARGDIAKVDYPGAAGTGYRRVSTDEAVSQQAYAGAARSAGGDRTGSGTFDEGWTQPDDAPDLAAVFAFGEAEVLPAVAQDLIENGSPELAAEVRTMNRDPERTEDAEPTGRRPFNGYENAVRIYPRSGRAFEYSVDVNRDAMRRDQ